MKYLVPGFAESMVRYTKDADGIGVERKIQLLNEIYFPIMPEFYSLMHVAAIAPFPKLLSKLLDLGYLYSIDTNGKTPLTYALDKNNSECIEKIIHHFKAAPDDFVITYRDVIMLLEKDTPFTPELFRISFFNYSKLNAAPQRGVITGHKHHTLFSSSEVIKGSDLRRDGISLTPETQSTPAELEYLVSKFDFNPVQGSKESL